MATFLKVVNTLCRVTVTGTVLYGGYRVDQHLENISSSLKPVGTTCDTFNKLTDAYAPLLETMINDPSTVVSTSSTPSYRSVGGLK